MGAARNEAWAALKQAIRRLPEDYQQVVRMYDLEEQPVETVARVLQRSPGAVYMVRARAHRMLRDLLGGPSDYFTNA